MTDATITEQSPLHHLISELTLNSLVSITGTSQVYERSKLFSTQAGINPLVTAAAPILALLEHIANEPNLDDIPQLRTNLLHEFNAFNTRAKAFKYDSETIVITHYILVVVLIDFLPDERWQQTFKHPNHDANDFFKILERLSQEPALHIDILELMYLCLSMGYIGPYQTKSNGYQTLQNISEHLYEKIHEQRGDSLNQTYIASKQPARRRHRRKPYSLSLAVILAIFMMILISSGFNYLQAITATPIFQQLNSITQLIQNYLPKL